MKKSIFLFIVLHFALCFVKAEVSVPRVPEKMKFAGEEISFDRYDIRESMDRELINFTYQHSTVILMLKRANRILPEVEKILKEEKVPDDFKYLMLVESNANPLSKSPAGAAGPWQFMESTAKEYGLEVNSNVDERYNIEKSTRAACAYLRKAKNKLGSWTSAAASYNAGQGKISSEMTKQSSSNVYDLYLPLETHRYIFRILAMKMLVKNPELFGFDLKASDLYAPYEYTEVEVTTEIADLAEWGSRHAVSYAQIKELNPWLRGRGLTNKSGKKYVIRVLKKSYLYHKPQNNTLNLR